MNKYEITLDADAYKQLTEVRHRGESFSEAIKRLTAIHPPSAQPSTQDVSTDADPDPTPPENCEGASDIRGRVYIDRYPRQE